MASTVEQHNRNILIVNVAQLIKSVPGKCMDKVVKSVLVNPATIHILNFEGVDQLSEDHKLALLSYGQILRKNSKFFYSVGFNLQLKENLKRRETIDFFDIKPDLESVPGFQRKKTSVQVTNDTSKPQFVLSANYVQMFADKAKYVLETQLHLPLQALKPYIKGMHFDRFQVEVASFIEVKSKYLKGGFAFTFTESVYIKTCKAVTGEDMTKITIESLDTLCELLNMTYGCIKQEINKEDAILEMSLPKKIIPTEMDLYHSTFDKSVVVPFQTKLGFIGFEIILDRN